MMFRSSLFILLLSFTSAFVVERRTCQRIPVPAIQMVSEVDERVPTPANWRQLPSRVPKDGYDKELPGFEIYIGRIAMVSFIALLAREVISGESFSEQFLILVDFLTGSNL
mmetsp:Transcript_13154/g.24689  ORF Transcript_13154/g.24689 Transcript_13154/m.24689 type:complete len:111 (-) Transcript_13154:1729-2061(-)